MQHTQGAMQCFSQLVAYISNVATAATEAVICIFLGADTSSCSTLYVDFDSIKVSLVWQLPYNFVVAQLICI